MTPPSPIDFVCTNPATESLPRRIRKPVRYKGNAGEPYIQSTRASPLASSAPLRLGVKGVFIIIIVRDGILMYLRDCIFY